MGLAARSTDMHVCPASDGPKPHVGGPILPGGNTTVIIGGLPAAVVGDSCTCAGPPDTLIKGSSSVLIAGKPAVRMGDSTAHGGQVILGCFTVLIGD
ncbi:PAAR domain-containing protein [Chryseobacterium kwangjuense]|uniref:PAAR domain-containing protein n=1 Tax=Chryseobacterium kwangjuense TaxID=267125 RepID=A0ABW9K2F6_9FLAO